jgi:hypothetical protein
MRKKFDEPAHPYLDGTLHAIRDIKKVELPGHVKNPGTVYRRFQPRCECGWTGRHLSSEERARQAFQSHVVARELATPMRPSVVVVEKRGIFGWKTLLHSDDWTVWDAFAKEAAKRFWRVRVRIIDTRANRT